MSRLEVGVSCQHGAQPLQGLDQVALVGLGSSANSSARTAGCSASSAPATRSPGRVSRTGVARRSVGVGEAFDRPVALQRVHEPGDVAGGDAQLAAQVE